MPTFAVLMRYEVASALIVEAKDSEEAMRVASEFEERGNDAMESEDGVTVSNRVWGDGTVEVEEASGVDAAEDMLDAWLDEDEDEDDDEDLDGEDDEFDALDVELGDEDESDEDDDATDEQDRRHDDVRRDDAHAAEHDDDDFGGEIAPSK